MFSNRPNHYVKTDKGKGHWISRSVAVVAIVSCNEKYLIIKRGPHVSATNKWCVPCGYLDFDEDAAGCALRETYEESGLDLRKYTVTGLDKFDVNTDPSLNRNQDIVIYFNLKISSDTEPAYDLSSVDKGETLDIKWISIEEVPNYDFAFNHDKRILNER